MIRRDPGTQILLLFHWQVAGGALMPAALGKLTPYLTRYADTLGIRVWAVGGTGDHCHVLADVPADMPASRVPGELHPPTARYLRDVVGVAGFAWGGTVGVVSVSPGERDSVILYLTDHESRETVTAWEPVGGDAPAPDADALPAWLTGTGQ